MTDPDPLAGLPPAVASFLRRHARRPAPDRPDPGRHLVGKAARRRLAPPAVEAARLGIPTAEAAALQREMDLRCGEDTAAREMVARLAAFVRDCALHGEVSPEAAAALEGLASACLDALAGFGPAEAPPAPDASAFLAEAVGLIHRGEVAGRLSPGGALRVTERLGWRRSEGQPYAWAAVYERDGGSLRVALDPGRSGYAIEVGVWLSSLSIAHDTPAAVLLAEALAESARPPASEGGRHA